MKDRDESIEKTFARKGGLEPYENFESNPTGESTELCTERILRKTETYELVERPFTTSPKRYVKRGCKAIRSRSMKYYHYWITHQIKEMLLDDSKELFSQLIGVWDRTTIRAYFGSQEPKSYEIESIKKDDESGKVYRRNITLTRKSKRTKGYLEKLNLFAIEKRGQNYFITINELVVIPEIAKRVHNNERHSLEQSIDNLSLIPFSQGERARENRFEKVVSSIETTGTRKKQYNNNNLRGERNQYCESERGIQNCIQDSWENEVDKVLETLASATPLDSLPDRAKIEWRDS